MRSTWVKFLNGWIQVEDGVNWTKLVNPRDRLPKERDQWIERGIFMFWTNTLCHSAVSNAMACIEDEDEWLDIFVSSQICAPKAEGSGRAIRLRKLSRLHNRGAWLSGTVACLLDLRGGWRSRRKNLEQGALPSVFQVKRQNTGAGGFAACFPSVSKQNTGAGGFAACFPCVRFGNVTHQ